jgi:putative Holliday junction resolvase
VRALGIDVGDRRIGLAVSDPSGTLARPLKTIERSSSIRDTIELIAREIHALEADAPITVIVVGLPLGLDGSPTEQTDKARQFAKAIAARVELPLHYQDERLSSREAESRLASNARDWRQRKKRLDAAAAAVILQDYLDLQGESLPL